MGPHALLPCERKERNSTSYQGGSEGKVRRPLNNYSMRDRVWWQWIIIDTIQSSMMQRPDAKSLLSRGSVRCGFKTETNKYLFWIVKSIHDYSQLCYIESTKRVRGTFYPTCEKHIVQMYFVCVGNFIFPTSTLIWSCKEIFNAFPKTKSVHHLVQ
jgi:hypothetical protein